MLICSEWLTSISVDCLSGLNVIYKLYYVWHAHVPSQRVSERCIKKRIFLRSYSSLAPRLLLTKICNRFRRIRKRCGEIKPNTASCAQDNIHQSILKGRVTGFE